MHRLSTLSFRFCFIALFVMGCASGSSTVTVGGKSVEMPTEVAEEHQMLIDNIGLYDDPELDAYVRRVGERLLEQSGITSPEFTFTLLDSPDINAFAMPGGFIYMNRGLLNTSTRKQNWRVCLRTRLVTSPSDITPGEKPRR